MGRHFHHLHNAVLMRQPLECNHVTYYKQNYRIASAGFSCSGLGTFGWTSVGRWRTRMSRLGSVTGRGSSTAPAAISTTDIPLEDSSSRFRHERPTRIPSRRLRSGPHPVQPKGTEGITVCGLDISRPRLTAASSCASHPCYTGCHVKPQSRQLSTDAGPLARAPLRALKRPAWCYVTSTGRRVIKPVR